MRRRAMGLVAALAALAATPRGAMAQDAGVKQAKMFFDAGAQAYAAGRYDVAIDTFGQAYKLAPRPSVLFSLAQAERKQYFVAHDAQHARRAFDLYRQYLQRVDSGGRRADAADAIAELEPIVGRMDANASTTAPTPAAATEAKLIVSSQTPGATVALDGHPAVATPLSESVQPGKHRVRVVADGFFDDDREVVVRPGDPFTPVEVTLREKPARVAIDGDEGAEILVDGRVVGTTPLARDLEVASGTHGLALTKNGYEAFTREVTLERGKRQVIVAHIVKTPQRVVSYVTLATGVAALITGGVCIGGALVEQGKAQKVLDDKASGHFDASQIGTYNDAIDGRDQWKVVARVAFGAGAALVVVGGLLYLFDKPSVVLGPPPAESGPKPKSGGDMEMSAAPWFGPGMAGAALGGRF